MKKAVFNWELLFSDVPHLVTYDIPTKLRVAPNVGDTVRLALDVKSMQDLPEDHAIRKLAFFTKPHRVEIEGVVTERRLWYGHDHEWWEWHVTVESFEPEC